jgi:hypothetical protein
MRSTIAGESCQYFACFEVPDLHRVVRRGGDGALPVRSPPPH